MIETPGSNPVPGAETKQLISMSVFNDWSMGRVYIDHKERWAYTEAAGYAYEIKLIYTIIIKDVIAWDSYIKPLLSRYKNFYALQDEFRKRKLGIES